MSDDVKRGKTADGKTSWRRFKGNDGEEVFIIETWTSHGWHYSSTVAATVIDAMVAEQLRPAAPVTIALTEPEALTEAELALLMEASFTRHRDWAKVVDVALGQLNDCVFRIVGAGELSVEGREGVIRWFAWPRSR